MIEFRQHPLAIIQGIGKSLILIAFPLIRRLLALRFDIYTWLLGDSLDIAILLTVLGYAFLRFRSKKICITDEYIITKSGIIFRQVSKIPSEKITTIYLSKNPFYSVFGAVWLVVETNAKTAKKSDFSMLISRRNAKRLEHYTDEITAVNVTKSYIPRMRFVIFYAIQSTSTLSGILLLSTLFSQGGAILGRQLRREFLATVDSFSSGIVLGIPPILISISIILLVGWIIGFVFNVIRCLKFSVTRKSSVVIVNKGIFVRQKYFIPSANIISIEKRQSVLTQILGISSVFISASGYGKVKGESAVIFPALNSDETEKTVSMIIPEFKFSKRLIKAEKNSILSFVFLPLLLSLFLITAINFIEKNYPNLLILKLLIIIGLIPCVWLCIVRLIASKQVGYDFSDDVTICYLKGFSIRRVCFKKGSIAKIEIIRNPLNRIFGKCKLKVYCRGESVAVYTVIGLNMAKTAKTVSGKYF